MSLCVGVCVCCGSAGLVLFPLSLVSVSPESSFYDYRRRFFISLTVTENIRLPLCFNKWCHWLQCK